ncbi:MAG: hypothetical protein DCF32_06885 [Leptolyngbya sp.]|nr:MAG: hypothetical protein DCF32_06885 [Leptolyngbya sp.]
MYREIWSGFGSWDDGGNSSMTAGKGPNACASVAPSSAALNVAGTAMPSIRLSCCFKAPRDRRISLRWVPAQAAAGIANSPPTVDESSALRVSWFIGYRPNLAFNLKTGLDRSKDKALKPAQTVKDGKPILGFEHGMSLLKPHPLPFNPSKRTTLYRSE